MLLRRNYGRDSGRKTLRNVKRKGTLGNTERAIIYRNWKDGSITQRLSFEGC